MYSVTMFRPILLVFLITTGTIKSFRVSRLEKRLNLMEERMLEDKIAVRDDIEMILEKLEDISYNTSEISHKRKMEKDDSVTNSPKLKIDDFFEIVKKAMRDEKYYVRNDINDVREEVKRIRNDFTDIATQVLKNKKEQSIIVEVLKGDLIHQGKEMKDNYKELERTVASNSKNIEKVLNEVLKDKFIALKGDLILQGNEMKELERTVASNSKDIEKVLNELKDNTKEVHNENELFNLRLNEIVKKLGNLSLRICSDSTWTNYGTSCYYVGKEELTWEGAFNRCASFGAQLVEVDNDAENTFVVNLVKEKGVGGMGVWLSGTDQKTEGLWIWGTSGEVINNIYSNFKGHEPNGKTTENCLHLYSPANWIWNDVRCDRNMGYVCEQEHVLF